jgi:hypothetical protein
MRRAAAVPFALLLGSTILIAQSAIAQKDIQNRKTTLQASQLPNSCPISLHAQQSSAAFARRVDSAGPEDNNVSPKGIAQSLHLTVTNPDTRYVVAANITVRGFANKGRLLQTMSNQDPSDATKTLDVRFPAGPGKEVSADLSVPGLSAVSAIDLNSVTYSDGSMWKLAAGSSCRSWIDGFMLVSSH